MSTKYIKIDANTFKGATSVIVLAAIVSAFVALGYSIENHQHTQDYEVHGDVNRVHQGTGILITTAPGGAHGNDPLVSIDPDYTATVATTQTLSNKTLNSVNLGTPQTGNLSNCSELPINGTAWGNAELAAFLTSPTGSNLATVLGGTATGSGDLVFAMGPAITNPELTGANIRLGTPQSGTLTNCTGYTLANISGINTDISTFLANPSSANLATAVNDETGSGDLVFATNPQLNSITIAGTWTASAATCTDLGIVSNIDIEGGTIDGTTIGATSQSTGSFTTVTATTGITGTLTGNVTGNVTGSVTGNVIGNASSATALQTLRSIGGVNFDGTSDINLPGVNTAGNQDTSGNAATATTATNASNVNLVNETADNSCPIVFATGATGNQELKTNSPNLIYDAVTGTLSAPTVTATSGFTGTFSGDVTVGAGKTLDVDGTVDIDASSGNMDNVTIGATTAAAITGTTITASTGFTGDVTGNLTGDVTGTVNTVIQNSITTMTGLVNIGATTVNTTFAGPIVASEGVTGNADTATALATGRTIGMTGDVTYTSASFDGSANVTGTATLANSGATAGSYGGSTEVPVLTVDAKGRITSASTAAISSSGSFTLEGGSGTGQTISDGDTLTIAGGTNISTVVGATDTLTINLDSTLSGLTSVAATTFTGNLTGTVNTVTQNSITTMTGLQDIGATGVDTTFAGPIVANENFKVTGTNCNLNATNISFFDVTTAISQPTGPLELTDSTGGTAGTTLTVCGNTTSSDQAATINDNFASIVSELNQIRTVLTTLGLASTV